MDLTYLMCYSAQSADSYDLNALAVSWNENTPQLDCVWPLCQLAYTDRPFYDSS